MNTMNWVNTLTTLVSLLIIAVILIIRNRNAIKRKLNLLDLLTTAPSDNFEELIISAGRFDYGQLKEYKWRITLFFNRKIQACQCISEIGRMCNTIEDVLKNNRDIRINLMESFEDAICDTSGTFLQKISAQSILNEGRDPGYANSRDVIRGRNIIMTNYLSNPENFKYEVTALVSTYKQDETDESTKTLIDAACIKFNRSLEK